MNNRLSKAEFSESLDRRLSGLQGDPWLKAKVLGKAEGEKPVKKVTAATVLIAVLLVVAVAGALALSGWNVIARILEGYRVNEEAVVSPLKAESDIRSLQFTATEAYWAGDELSVVLRVECTDPCCLPYYEEGEHPEEIEYNGETISADDLRGDRQLIACEVWSGSCWTWYSYTDEGMFIIITVPDPDAAELEKGTSMTFSCSCTNLQTEETEDGTVSVELPPMVRQEGYAAE